MLQNSSIQAIIRITENAEMKCVKRYGNIKKKSGQKRKGQSPKERSVKVREATEQIGTGNNDKLYD